MKTDRSTRQMLLASFSCSSERIRRCSQVEFLLLETTQSMVQGSGRTDETLSVGRESRFALSLKERMHVNVAKNADSTAVAAGR